MSFTAKSFKLWAFWEEKIDSSRGNIEFLNYLLEFFGKFVWICFQLEFFGPWVFSKCPKTAWLVSNINKNYPWFSAVLVPLFGLHNLTSAFMPDSKDWPGVRKSLEMFSALSISFQGSIVAVIFCFMNSEVGSQIEKALAGSEVRNQKTCQAF